MSKLSALYSHHKGLAMGHMKKVREAGMKSDSGAAIHHGEIGNAHQNAAIYYKHLLKHSGEKLPKVKATPVEHMQEFLPHKDDPDSGGIKHKPTVKKPKLRLVKSIDLADKMINKLRKA